MAQPPTIDRLLNLVPDAPDAVLTSLRAHPQLASQQDAHGYSLVHAATSYGHVGLLKALIQELNVLPNITDEDGETCLFNAETVEMANEVLALGVNIDVKNTDGQTAAEKLADEDEQPLVATYLRQVVGRSNEAASSIIPQTTSGAADTGVNGNSNGLHVPSPLPNGVQINMGLMEQGEEGGEPDPEFRRRIEELASRQDFDGEESQRELRELVTQAITGISTENEGQGSATRRRLG